MFAFVCVLSALLLVTLVINLCLIYNLSIEIQGFRKSLDSVSQEISKSLDEVTSFTVLDNAIQNKHSSIAIKQLEALMSINSLIVKIMESSGQGVTILNDEGTVVGTLSFPSTGGSKVVKVVQPKEFKVSSDK